MFDENSKEECIQFLEKYLGVGEKFTVSLPVLIRNTVSIVGGMIAFLFGGIGTLLLVLGFPHADGGSLILTIAPFVMISGLALVFSPIFEKKKDWVYKLSLMICLFPVSFAYMWGGIEMAAKMRRFGSSADPTGSILLILFFLVTGFVSVVQAVCLAISSYRSIHSDSISN